MTWMVLFFVIAVINWGSVEYHWRRVELASKPLALLVLLACFWELIGWQGGKLWFGLGLVFSLAGDTLLLWPKRFFLPGLIAFLIAHVFYIIGLNQDAIPLQFTSLLALVLAAAVGYSCHRTIRKGMRRKPENEALRWPVLFYCLVITLMMLSAWLCILKPEWPPAAGWLAAIGATLFVVSDSLLAYGMFVRPLEHGELMVMITYHLGQVGILAGVLLRFSG